MEQLPRRRCWLPSPALLIFFGVGVIATLLLLPAYLNSCRASPKRQASTLTKTFSSAEDDFRTNDRDHNKVRDFWTGDVSGLYYLKPVDGGAEVRLIDVDVANADAKPIYPLPPSSGPRQGYRYQALDRDDSVEGEKWDYRAAT